MYVINQFDNAEAMTNKIHCVTKQSFKNILINIRH